jgi:hypothetical protein
MGDCPAKSVFRHPDEVVFVRCQLRRFWMGFVAIKHLSDGLALIGRKRGDINEGFNSRLVYRADYSPSVSVAS